MEPKYNFNLKKHLSKGLPVILELGCGRSKTAGRIGIDALDLPGVDIVHNLDRGLTFLPDSSVDEIHSISFFEHVNDLGELIREIVRVLKPNARCHVFVPHFSNPYYYSDFTHHNFMGLYTFYYFVDERYQLKRKVPCFYTDVRIRILSQRLVMANPYEKTAYLKRGIGKIVNTTSRFQEFYERNLCWIVPCYGIETVFIPQK